MLRLIGRRSRAAIAALIGVALIVGMQTIPAFADTNVSIPFKVNFQAQTSATPAGYNGDFGKAYDAARGWGWVDASTGTPLSLIGNGRERNVAADKRLDTLMQPQLPAGSAGVTTVGAWKAAVPNGTYSVTVAAGDPSYTNSHNVVNIEGANALDFTPTGTAKSQTVTVTTEVTDGYLNVDFTGGTNSKIDYLEIASTTTGGGGTSPTITAVTPSNGSTGVARDTAVTVQLSNGVDANSVDSNSLQLFSPSNVQISGHYNTDGAYSNATFAPSAYLASNTTYTVKTTTQLKDNDGNSYPAFTSTFTTGTSTSTQQADVSFTKSTFDSGNGASGTNDTSAPVALKIGPDGKLYAAFGDGRILAYTLDSATGKKVGTPTVINAFTGTRTLTSLEFDPAATASNIILWVSNAQANCDLAHLGNACDDFTGNISKLTGADAAHLTRTDVITGLPRSVGNHMNNGIEFGPDGFLYLAQGANNGYGAKDQTWGQRAEVPLAAAVLKMDVKNITSFPYNVNTSTGYNPSASGAKVTLYATGIRNPFSLVWASNGKLYAPVNESADGNTPADPNGTAPALNNLPAYNDYFTQVIAGKYYGHPNPSRNEYILNGGNPTSSKDPFEVSEYPVGTQPNSNWRKPDIDLGAHRSMDGSVEFTSDVFGDKLKGQILTTEYAGGKDIIAIKLDASGNAVSKTVVANGFYNPLGITSDPTTGRVYVTEYGHDPDGANGQITLLSPNGGGTTTPPPGTIFHVDFQDQAATTAADYVADYGQAWDDARGLGWETNAGAPLSLVGNGRERNAVTDQRKDTLMQMQLAAGATGVATPGRWELQVPNGTYQVELGLGDPSYTNSHNVINIEGNTFADFTPTAAQPQMSVTGTVVVSDGRLTMDAVGGTNTKVTYIDLTADGSGDPGGSTTTSAKVNFQAQTTVTPTDYAGDYGKAYDPAVGFGWIDTANSPVSLVGNGRERTGVADKRLGTFMHMQLPAATSGVHTEGKWELGLANGSYDVTVGVGDPGYTNSHDVINAEGTKIVDFTPTTGNFNQVVTATINVADGKLTLDAAGGDNTKIDYVDVVPHGTGGTTDTVAPTITATPSGTTNSSGAYVGSATITVVTTDTGSGVKNVTYTLDGGVSQAYGDPIVVNTVGDHTIVVTASDNANNIATKTVTFKVASTGTQTPASLKVTSPEDVLGLGSKLVFSTVKDASRPGHAFTVTNTGTGNLNITGLTIGGTNGTHFKLDSAFAASTLAPGASKSFIVNYRPTAGTAATGGDGKAYISTGTLTVNTNDANVPAYVVGLSGLNQKAYEGVTEPSLQYVIKALGYNVNAGVTDLPKKLAIGPLDSPASADEVRSAYWKKLDTTKSVTMFPLAHYSGKDLTGADSTNYGWFDQTTGSQTSLYRFKGFNSSPINDGYGENQKLFPGTTSSNYTINTNNAFGLFDGQGNKSDDDKVSNGHWHNYRFYVAKDANGAVIPGMYIVGDDIGIPQNNGAKNWDYQDYLFLLTNVQPVGGNTGDVSPLSKSIDFTGSEGGISNTGFASAQGSTNTANISIANGKLSVKTASDSNTSHTNALQIPFNAGTNFRVQARLVGPFDAINAGQEQQAIFWGIDATHYIKAELEYSGGQRKLTIWRQDGGSGAVLGSVALPGGNANTVDFQINSIPSSYSVKDANGQVTKIVGPYADVSYAVNGGGYTKIPVTGSTGTMTTTDNVKHVAIPDSWITADGTEAGIMTSHQGGGSQFTAVYESFSVNRYYP